MGELAVTDLLAWGDFALVAQYFAPDALPRFPFYWASWPWVLWYALAFFGIFPGIVAYMVWAERKVAARFQDRIGPNRVGPLGLLQPIADAIKLVTKENIVPRLADRWVHLLAPVLLIISAFLVLAVIPFGVGYREGTRYLGLVPIDPPAGLVYLLAASSLSTLGIFLAGWSSRNKYSLLGAMRAAAQLISYEVPQVLATIPVVLWTGSLSLVAIMNKQIEYDWFLFSPPGLVSFAILTIASIAEVNRTPFDLPEAESEIIAGYHTEYSGMRFGLFFLAEYMSVFAVSCLGTVLFLGGGTLPYLTEFPFGAFGTSSWVGYLLSNGPSVAFFSMKVLLYIFFMFWVRATLPRMRVDRLMNFAWKYLVPLSLINIVIAAIWFEIIYRPPSLHYVPIPLLTGLFGIRFNVTALWGWIVTLPLVVFSVWFIHRLYLTEKVAPEVVPAPGRRSLRKITAVR
jgi:NADH-quinone oxidoreductase subunit H